MATFRFGHFIDIHWNGYDIVGDGGTIFSIPDQLYEEFESDIRPVEPTLEWIDTNEFQTLKNSVTNYTVVATSPISVASTTSTKTWSLIDGGITSAKIADLAVNAAKINSGTASNGYVLTANGSTGAAWAAQTGSGGGITSIVGTDPISATVLGANATVSLNANYATSTHLHTGTYQPAGTYVTSISGTAPISATGTTSVTISIDQTAISAAAATSALNTRTYVRNATASTIAKGSVVYLASSNGTIPTIEKALATTDATSARTFGITESDISSNSNGYVLNQGIFDPIDTFGIADGAVLWLSSTVAGAYSTVKPTGPNHGVLVGVCVKGHSVGSGSIYVFIKNGSELDEIHDVNISSLIDGQALIYNSAQSVWINQSLATASTSAYGYTTLVDSVTSTSTIAAATPNSVQIANAAATAAQVTANAASSAAATAQTTANGRVATVAGDTAISSTGTTAISLAHTTTDGYHHVPATSTTNSGKFLKAGATAGSEAWAAISTSDVTTGNYVATITQGTGVTVTAQTGNAATPTVSIGQAVATTSNVTFGTVSSGNITSTAIISSANISSGAVDITPVANATTGAAVTGLSVKTSAATATVANVSILATAYASSDALRTCAVQNATFSGANCTGFTAYVFRTNTTVTNVHWMVLGR
jgi:hypothetical protein